MKQCETNRIQYQTRGVQVTCCITRCPTVFLSRLNMVLLRVISNNGSSAALASRLKPKTLTWQDPLSDLWHSTFLEHIFHICIGP